MTSHTRTDTLERIRARIDGIHGLELAATDLHSCAPNALRAFQLMQDARPGLPGAQAYDAPNVTGGSSELTQPERLADRDDPTERDRRRLDTALHRLDFLTGSDGHIIDRAKWCASITADALTVRRLVEAWTPHAPTDKQRREVQAVNHAATECTLTRSELNCFDGVYRTSDLYGLLPEPAAVGLWVHRFARDHRRLPTPQEWRAHASKDDDLRKQLIATVKR